MRTHLLTGAGSGIGAAIADACYRRGDHLILLARSAKRGSELLIRWPGSQIVVTDLTDSDATEAAFAETELPTQLQSVVHSAGIGTFGHVDSATAADWNSVLAVNLVSPVVVTRACLPALRRGSGTVVFLNSGAGLHASPDWSAYAASKFGLRAVADSLRAEEQANGVRVSTVYPGRTATPMQAALHEHEGATYDPDQWIQPETVALAVLQILDLGIDATIPDLTLRPR